MIVRDSALFLFMYVLLTCGIAEDLKKICYRLTVEVCRVTITQITDRGAAFISTAVRRRTADAGKGVLPKFLSPVRG